MTRYTPEQLASIVSEHGIWLSGNGGSRADLSGADLSGANLSGAYLSGADGAETAIAARSYRVNMAQLVKWAARHEGRAWVETIGGSISYLDCLQHGKDDYAQWLYPRVLTLLIEAQKAEAAPTEAV